MVLEGRLSLSEASDRMKISYRHAKWLKGMVARDGPRVLIHGNAGKRPANAIVAEKGLLAAVAPLCHMMGDPRRSGPCYSGHNRIVALLSFSVMKKV